MNNNNNVDSEIHLLKKDTQELRTSIFEIKTDIAVIKEKNNTMNDKINSIETGFDKLVCTVDDMREESSSQHKAMIKAIVAAGATLGAALLSAVALVITASL
jgi:serine-rich repeat adhesion-like glycoprotein